MMKQRGFSLIEAMVAIAIVSIGFVGIYALVGAAENFQARAAQRNATVMVVEQVFDVVAATSPDIIDAIAEPLTFNGTVDLASANCQYAGAQANSRPLDTNDFATFFQQWCLRMNNTLGLAGAADIRSITVFRDTPTAAGVSVNVVTINIQGANGLSIVDTRAL